LPVEPLDELADYGETQEFLDFLGLDNLQEHLALESFRYAMGASYLWERANSNRPWEDEEFATREVDSAEDDEIPF
jgi:hypothetical protein